MLWFRSLEMASSKKIHFSNFATHHDSLQFLLFHCFLTLWQVNHHLNLAWSTKDEVLRLKIRKQNPMGPLKVIPWLLTEPDPSPSWHGLHVPKPTNGYYKFLNSKIITHSYSFSSTGHGEWMLVKGCWNWTSWLRRSSNIGFSIIDACESTNTNLRGCK